MCSYNIGIKVNFKMANDNDFIPIVLYVDHVNALIPDYKPKLKDQKAFIRSGPTPD